MGSSIWSAGPMPGIDAGHNQISTGATAVRPVAAVAGTAGTGRRSDRDTAPHAGRFNPYED